MKAFLELKKKCLSTGLKDNLSRFFFFSEYPWLYPVSCGFIYLAQSRVLTGKSELGDCVKQIDLWARLRVWPYSLMCTNPLWVAVPHGGSYLRISLGESNSMVSAPKLLLEFLPSSLTDGLPSASLRQIKPFLFTLQVSVHHSKQKGNQDHDKYLTK